MNLFTALTFPAGLCKPLGPSNAELDLSALMGQEAWMRLSVPVRRRFGLHAAPVAYRGHLDLDCSAMGRVLAWLSWPLKGPLVPHRAHGLPVEVGVASDGHGGVAWTRRLGSRTVSSVKQRHPVRGVLERTSGGLAMALDVLEHEGALVFQSRQYLWCIGRWCLPLPSWLSPGTCRVEHRDLGGGQFRFTLTMTHPRLGLTFQQAGVFEDPVQE